MNPAGSMQQLPLGVQLEVSSRFETFRVGHNRAAVEDLLAVIRGPGQVPLWLCGATGTGKSHLLQATCARVSDRGGAVAYLPLDRCASLGPAVLEGLEQLDVVLLDDVDTVAGRDDWERALFRLYNELQERRGRLVVAAREAPVATRFTLPDLASRFAASAVHALRPLPEEEQAEALAARAASRGLELAPGTLAYLLRHAPRDFGALCRLLAELDSASLATRRRITVPLARDVLERR
jgi:DnaA family protein